jgi:hypothetical protein
MKNGRVKGGVNVGCGDVPLSPLANEKKLINQDGYQISLARLRVYSTERMKRLYLTQARRI